MKHLDIKLIGKVQGVGLRYKIKEIADELSLYGYARNLDDSSVSIEIEGSEASISKFWEWLESNPGHSNITGLKKVEGQIKKYRDFQIY